MEDWTNLLPARATCIMPVELSACWPRLVALTARVYKGAGHALRDDMLGDAARFLAGCLEEIPS